MKFNFTKWQGCGNDFVFVNGFEEKNIDEIVARTAEICDRNYGIGADGVILILPSEIADFKMRIINSDGSEPEMCGNGIRCFAKAVKKFGLSDKSELRVETGAGIIIPRVEEDGFVRVDMGEPILDPKLVPVQGLGDETVISKEIVVDGESFKVTCVSMGNPHCVIFVDDMEKVNLAELGSKIEVDPHFPKKTNVEFIEVIDDSHMRMRVWERGAGITLACGTGTCGSHVAAVLNKLVGKSTEVQLDGGILRIEWAEDNHVYMTGPGELVFEGVWNK